MTFNGPVRPASAGSSGIYWVCSYESATDAVVVVTEVPGNPGRSVVNTISQIATDLRQRSLVPTSNARWFACFPGGFGGQSRATYIEASVGESGVVDWPGVEYSIEEMDSLLGAPLARLPAHEDVLSRVLDLGGVLPPPPDVLRWEIVPGESLPPPGDPFRCDLHAEFLAFVAQHESVGRSRAEASAMFFDSLSANDYGRCRRHTGDWAKIAATAVSIVQHLGAFADVGAVRASAEEYGLEPSERDWLYSIFEDPMWWNEDGYGNGQHRGCALRASGAPQVILAAVDSGTRPGEVWVLGGEA